MSNFNQNLLSYDVLSLTSSYRYSNQTQGAEVLLYRIYHQMNEIKLNYGGFDQHWLPRNFRMNSLPILNIPIRLAMSRSRRLLNSLDELRQNALEPQYNYTYFTEVWEEMFKFDKNILSFAYSWETIQQSHERAVEVDIIENDLTAEFLEARDDPHACLCGSVDEDYMNWAFYKEKCRVRSKWGEYLRCSMDWDWDTGSCLKHLFKVERLLYPNTVDLELIEANGRDRDILQVKIGGARTTMPEGIQVPYKDEFGRTWYKTFYPGPSSEDFTSFTEETEQTASQEFSRPLSPTGSAPGRTTKRMRIEHETGTGDMSYRAVYAGQSLEDVTSAPNTSWDSILDGPRKRANCEINQDGEDGPLVSASYDSKSVEPVKQLATAAIVQGVGDDSMDVDSSESENFQEHVSENPSSLIRDVEYDSFDMDIQEAREQDPSVEIEQAFKDMQYRDVDELSYADSTTTYHTAFSYSSNEENL